jgi:hypothetical protein
MRKNSLEGKWSLLPEQDKIEFATLRHPSEKSDFLIRRGFSFRHIKSVCHVGQEAIKNQKSLLSPVRYEHISHKTIPKTKSTKENIARIITLREQYRYASDQWIANEMFRHFHIVISKSLVNKITHSAKFKFLPTKKRERLTEKQRTKRLKFATTMLRSSLPLNEIIYSDESRFVLGADKRWVWRRRGDHDDTIYTDTDKYPASIMVFGAIGMDFKSKLIIITGNVDSNKYIEVLQISGLVDFFSQEINNGKIFQQDGVPAHRCCRSKKYIRTIMNLLENWPPNSPDLNIIENIWAIMKRAVAVSKPGTFQIGRAHV